MGEVDFSLPAFPYSSTRKKVVADEESALCCENEDHDSDTILPPLWRKLIKVNKRILK